MGHYVTIRVETFMEGSERRVRPIGDKPFPRHLYVACSKKMREMYPVGTVFELQVQLIVRTDGSKYLMCPHTDPYEVVDRGPRPNSDGASSPSHAGVQAQAAVASIPPLPDESATGDWSCPGCSKQLPAAQGKRHASSCASYWLLKNPKGRV
jgi:hypothetical protein